MAFFIASSWFLIKDIYKKGDEAKFKTIQLLKWKRNPEIFLLLLYKQRTVDTSPWKNDIVLGNSNTEIQFIVACNPYCSPCAKAHEQLNELLEIYPEQVGITIRFTVNAENKEDKRMVAVSHILQVYLNAKTEEEKHAILSDWFKCMDLEKWKKTYSFCFEGLVPKIREGWNEVLQKHQQWGEENKITHTPTIFINGYELPSNYNASDLKLLIPTISEIIAGETVGAQAV